MNFRTIFASAAVAVSFALVACAAPTSTDDPSSGSDEALTAGAGHKMNTSVAATCNTPGILNGFIDPRQIFSAEITESFPAILNGFPVPTFSVTVKKAGEVQATLDHCTGNLANWDLHCTPSHEGLGVSETFDLSDKSHSKAVFEHRVIAPDAPADSRTMVCSPTEKAE
jgi:hypothetical protein